MSKQVPDEKGLERQALLESLSQLCPLSQQFLDGLVEIVFRRAQHPQAMSQRQFLRALLLASRDLDDVILSIREEGHSYELLRHSSADAHQLLEALMRAGIQPEIRKQIFQDKED